MHRPAGRKWAVASLHGRRGGGAVAALRPSAWAGLGSACHGAWWLRGPAIGGSLARRGDRRRQGLQGRCGRWRGDRAGRVTAVRGQGINPALAAAALVFSVGLVSQQSAVLRQPGNCAAEDEGAARPGAVIT